MSGYGCRKCGWSGSTPDLTDASEVRTVYMSDENGGGYETRTVRRMIPICPKCFHAVRRVYDTLTPALVDIALSQGAG